MRALAWGRSYFSLYSLVSPHLSYSYTYSYRRNAETRRERKRYTAQSLRADRLVSHAIWAARCYKEPFSMPINAFAEYPNWPRTRPTICVYIYRYIIRCIQGSIAFFRLRRGCVRDALRPEHKKRTMAKFTFAGASVYSIYRQTIVFN